MSDKHTWLVGEGVSGPWGARTISGSSGGVQRDAVVNLQITCKADTVEEVRALAAAAPDLLAALETALAICPRDMYGTVWAAEAVAAIAKAKGE